MFDLTPDPIAIQLGPLPVYWYGIGYALGLAAAYLVMVRLARRAGEDADILGNGMIIVAVAALIGGRLYHVIDQWALYQDDPIKIFLPPYSGLGVYGGIATGTVAAFLYARYKQRPVPALGGHHRAGPVRDAGHRPLGELLQPGAVRHADDAAVGHPDRLRAPDRGLSVGAESFPSRPSSTRCSCTSRSPGRSGRSSSSGSGTTPARGSGRAICS